MLPPGMGIHHRAFHVFRAHFQDFLPRQEQGFSLRADFVHDENFFALYVIRRSDDPLRFIVHHPVILTAGQPDRIHIHAQKMRQQRRRK